MIESYIVDGIDVQVIGSGAQTLLMLHGWPDSYRLWENTVGGLQSNFRCVRFSLPGFDIDKPARAVSLAQMTTLIAAIVEHVSPGRAVTLLVHDWGCLFGYEFAARHPDKVASFTGHWCLAICEPHLLPYDVDAQPFVQSDAIRRRSTSTLNFT